MHSFKTTNCTYSARISQLYNGFAQTVAGEEDTINGIPANGLVAWFNPAAGVTTMVRTAYDGQLAVANWADMSGTYHLQNTVYSQAATLSPPRYIASAGSIYNSKPYLFFDGSPGQSRNLTMLRKVDENWLLRNNGGYTVVYAQNHLSALGISSSFADSIAGGFYYDNSVFFRSFVSGVPYPFKSESLLPTGVVNIMAHYYNTTNGHWWWSLNDRYKAGYYTDAGIQRPLAEPANIYTVLPGTFIGFGATNTQMHLFDVFVYNRLLCEADYKKIYAYFKTRYLV